ncbi:MAG: capsular biosynthesis protein, partial [Tepidanaerobacteraceae bacterium]
ERMNKFIEEVSSIYDTVLFDTPPVNSVADASILSSRMDGVILVVEAGSTEREAVIIAKQQLEKVNARILGVVLNKVQQRSGSYYYYYYYYGEEDNERIRRKWRKRR